MTKEIIKIEEIVKDINSERQPCEVYSRVVGYLRPVKQWNDAKQAEYADRVEFKV